MSEWCSSVQAPPTIVDWQGRHTLDPPWVNWERSAIVSTLVQGKTRGVFDLKRRCTEWSVYDIKVPQELFESIRIHLLSYGSRGTVMSYTDHSVQRRFKSNTPNMSQIERLRCFVVGCNNEHSSRHLLPTAEPLKTQRINVTFVLKGMHRSRSA